MIIRDGDWVLWDADLKLKRTVWRRQEPDGSYTYRTDYQVDDTIDANAAQRNLAQAGWKGDYHMVASVPLNVFYEQLAQASKEGDDAYVNRWLNDSDNRAWRTKDGRV